MNVKNEKGSITMFVLVGLLFMTGFLLISLGSNVNKSKIAKEQFNIISGIYSKGDGDANAYNRAYTALRKKNKTTLTYDSGATSIASVSLEKTFNEKLINYQIYGSMSKNIVITVTNGTESKEYNIVLSNALSTGEYIDYKTKSVLDANGSVKESISSLPEIYAYEDNTIITITTGGTPSRILIEYVGYTM